MPADRQRRGREHEKHGFLAGWAWNQVSLKKKKKRKEKKKEASESGRNGAEGDRGWG